jgi:hypothetical protein
MLLLHSIATRPRPLPLPSTHFPIQYALIILPQIKKFWEEREREREREGERKWEVVRDTTLGGARNYIFGFEGSRAVPACPYGIGNAYYRNFNIHIYLYKYDAGRAALVKLELTLGGLY